MMRTLLLIALLACVPCTAQAGVSIPRGTGGNNTGATSVTVTPASNLAAGSTAVLVVAADNAGAAGSAANCNASMTDSVGNSWTKRLDVIYDPGAASAGIELCMYTGYLATAFTTANNVVVGFGNSVVAKSWTLTELAPQSALYQYVYVTGAGGTGAASGSPTVTTSSIPSGDVVVGGGASESTLTWTGDADSTNGNWEDEQEIGHGTGTSGAAVTSQIKITTGTGTQTYNPTQTSADQIIGWIQLHEELIATRRPIIIM